MVAGKPNAMFKKIVSTMHPEQGSPVPADPAIHPRGYCRPSVRITTTRDRSRQRRASETVDWIVLTQPIECGRRRYRTLRQLYPMNARPVQTATALHSQFWPTLKFRLKPMFRTLALSTTCLLFAVGSSHAACYERRLTGEGQEGKNIDQILAYGQCVKAEQRARVGKWVCQVSSTAGISREQRRVISDRISPANERFSLRLRSK